MNIPRNFIPSIEKVRRMLTYVYIVFVFCLSLDCLLQGFYEACERGFFSGHKISGVKFVLLDGKE